MEPASTTPCPNCERLQAQVDALHGQLEALQVVVALELVQRCREKPTREQEEFLQSFRRE